MASARICILGSINMDLVIRTPRFPAPGENEIGGPFATFPGGKGANQAVAAARLGASVALIACIGDDSHGTTIVSALRADGVDTRAVVRRSDIATGAAIITIDPSGENMIVVALGANDTLTADEVDRHRNAITTACVLLMQLETPISSILRAAQIARDAGVTVMLNAAPPRPVPPELMSMLDVLIVNRFEAAYLAGISTETDVRDVARRLRERGAQRVVMTLGRHGAAFDDGSQWIDQPIFPVTALDATAAGDAFAGAFAVRWAEGGSPAEALRWGAAAGALAVTKAGAIPSLPRRDEVELMLRSR